jgi:4-hydroxybenzoate polyprenyltransferase
MSVVKNYLSLIKFSHTIFALPFALIGFALGLWATPPAGTVPLDGSTIFTRLLLVIGCMVFARSAAMAFNRYLDRQFDAANPRTAIREIPAGLIKSNHALWFVLICCALFIVCTFFINRICFYLSPVALFVILFYSYTKRFTALCHLVLGLGLSLAPIGAYLAVTGVFDLLPILFSVTVLCWVSGFDIIYALQDDAFDRERQLHSIPVLLGRHRALRVSEFLHAAAIAMLLTAGITGHFGGWYWAGVVLFAALLVYQHLLVKPNDLRRVNLAFFTTNGIASVAFALFVGADLFITHGGWPLLFTFTPIWPASFVLTMA